MSAHDESWRTGCKVGRTVYRHDEVGEDGVLIGVMDTRGQATLAAAAPDLYRALEIVEWVCGGESEPDICPWCFGYQYVGHKADCDRQAALHKARGEG